MDGDPSSFSDAELQRIQYIWQRVAEDYAPFDVDVTTEDLGAEDLRNDGGDDTRWGIRCLITIDNFQGQGYGGYAYYNSFNWSSDTPAFVFENALQDNENYIAEAISHEVGHTLNLHHDGLDAAGVEYYKGHGSGDVGWAPIMGSGYYKNVTQFSKGEYNDPSNVEDDLAIITGSIPYRSDDHGDTPATATSLALLAGAFEGGGLIEQSSDLDVFSITVGTGAFAVSVAPYTRDPNLDLRLELLDAGGTVLAADNPASLLTASIDTTLSQGTYYLRLAGVGTGDPATGYSDYASIGQYRISGTATMPATGDPPSAVAAATPTSGSAPLSVAFSSAGSSDSDGTIVVKHRQRRATAGGTGLDE